MGFLRAPETTSLLVQNLSRPMLSVSRVRQPNYNHGIIMPDAAEPAFLISHQMIETEAEIVLDGHNIQQPCHFANHVTVLDFRREWRADMRTGFDAVNFYLPLSAFEMVDPACRVDDLAIAQGTAVPDTVISQISSALLPALDRPELASQLFLDHIGLAFAAHVGRSYAKIIPSNRATSLSIRQARRAKEMVDADIGGVLPLSELSDACDLPARALSDGFRCETGMLPYQWRTLRQTVKARDLLAADQLTIEEIAIACGFSDAAHLTSVFRKMRLCSPLSYRIRGCRH